MQLQLNTQTVPLAIRCLLAVAASLLSEPQRADWLREWHAEYWHTFGSRRGSRRRMWALAFGAFPDAWTLLRQDYGLLRRLHDAAHARATPVILLALLLTSATLLTGGFRRGRNLLFHNDPAGLVLIAQPIPFMGGRSRMPAAQAEAWLETSRTVARLGRWSIEDRPNSEGHTLVCRADAAALVLLSEAPVQPPCARIEPAESNVPEFAGVIARLRDGAAIHQAEEELARTAALHKGWAGPAVVSLAALRRTPLAPVGLSLSVLLLLSLLAVRVRTAGASIWAASKIVLSFASLAAIWIEFVARAPFTESAGIPAAWSALLYFAPVLAGCCAAWWFRRDWHRHCPICYRPLAMPVRIGIPGRSLLDPAGTEYLCGAGHAVWAP